MIDLIVTNGSVVFPDRFVAKVDIGVTNGKISNIGKNLGGARLTIDARDKFVFPGAIDSHFHSGIYRPLSEDARSESTSAVAGGVTTVLSYFRTGRYYMDTSEPYIELFPRVLSHSEGNYFSDYGYNLAPVTREHLDEVPTLAKEFGVTTFKFYMFLRGTEKATVSPAGSIERGYLLSDDPYDLGHLCELMKRVVQVRKKIESIRLSIHAEDPELIRSYTERVRSSPGEGLSQLEQLSQARPPESELLGILQASELSLYTGCPINILHLSSEISLNAIRDLKRNNPALDIVTETAPHYLVLDDKNNSNVLAKIFPPIRSSANSVALWNGIRKRQIDTVASDHCCSNTAFKDSDIWSARAGFGSSELLYPTLITEGHFKRGLPLEDITSLVTKNPARHFGLNGIKGDIEIGYDADLAILDLSKEKIVDHRQLHSAQNFSPYNGVNLKGWTETVVLRGKVVFENGKAIGGPSGEYLHRTRLLARSKGATPAN